MDPTDPSRVEAGADDLNLLGRFTGAAVQSDSRGSAPNCTVDVFADRFEVPEIMLSVRYEDVSDVVGGVPEELNRGIAKPIARRAPHAREKISSVLGPRRASCA